VETDEHGLVKLSVEAIYHRTKKQLKKKNVTYNKKDIKDALSDDIKLLGRRDASKATLECVNRKPSAHIIIEEPGHIKMMDLVHKIGQHLAADLLKGDKVKKHRKVDNKKPSLGL